MKKPIKIIALTLSFLLLFEQSGFAQIAGQLDLSLRLASLQNSFTQEKFRPLHLRYLSYNPQENNFKLLLDKGDLKSSQSTVNSPQNSILEAETKRLLNYFFVGVSLPNESFWVNLRPDSPENILDPELAKTEMGKVLLEADLQLKKDTANYTNPQTLEGRTYWTKLYQKAEELFGYEAVTIPTLTRPWIVPGEIIIRETQDNAYIYKATLKVMLEEDYLSPQSIVHSPQYTFSDPRLKALNEYSSQLIRELIIPKITKEINSSKKYAPLRQVYYSLILAQWFKARFRSQSIVNSPQSTVKTNPYLNLIDSQNLTGLTSKESWSKTAYFKAYQESFNKGEYKIQEPHYTPMGQTVRSYFSGGIMFGPQPGQPGPIAEAIKAGLVKGSPDRDPGRLNPRNTIGAEFSGKSGEGEVAFPGLTTSAQPSGVTAASDAAQAAQAASAVVPAQPNSQVPAGERVLRSGHDEGSPAAGAGVREDSASERLYSPQEALKAISGIPENVALAEAVDSLGVSASDFVLYVGAGSRWELAVACAIRGAHVDIVQPSTYYMQGRGLIHQTGHLETMIRNKRQVIAEVYKRDLIGDRIDTQSYQCQLEQAKLRNSPYSLALAIDVFEELGITAAADTFVSTLLGHLKDGAMVVTETGYIAEQALTEYGGRLGYTIESKRDVDFGDRFCSVYCIKKGSIQQKDAGAGAAAPAAAQPSSSEAPPAVGAAVIPTILPTADTDVSAAARPSPRAHSFRNWVISLIGGIIFWWGVVTQAQPLPAQPAGGGRPVPAETAKAPQADAPGYQAPATPAALEARPETNNSISTVNLDRDSVEYKTMAAFVAEHAPEDLRALLKASYEGWEQGRGVENKQALTKYLRQHYRHSAKDRSPIIVPVTGLLKGKGLKLYYDHEVAYSGVIFVDAIWYSSQAARQETDSIRKSIISSNKLLALRDLGILLGGFIISVFTFVFGGLNLIEKAIPRLRLRARFWSTPKQKPEIFPERDNKVYLSLVTAGGDTVSIDQDTAQLIDKKGRKLKLAFAWNSSEELTTVVIPRAARFLLDKQGLRTFQRLSIDLRKAKIARNSTLLLLIKMLAEGEDIQNIDDFLLRAVWFREKLGDGNAIQEKAYALAKNSPKIAVWLCVAELERQRIKLSDSVSLPGEILRLIRSTRPADYLSFVPALVNLLADRSLKTTSLSEKELINLLLKDILFDLRGYYIKDNNLQYIGELEQETQKAVIRKLAELIVVSENAPAKAELLAPYLGQMHMFPFMIDSLLVLDSPLINLIGLMDSLASKLPMKDRIHFFSLFTPEQLQAIRLLPVAHAREFVDAVELGVKNMDNPEQGNQDSQRVKRELFLLILNLGKNYPQMFILLRNFLHKIESEITDIEVPTQDFADFVVQGILRVPMLIDRAGKKYEYAEDATTLGVLLSVLARNPKNAVAIVDAVGGKITVDGPPDWAIDQTISRLNSKEPVPPLEILLRLFNPVLLGKLGVVKSMGSWFKLFSQEGEWIAQRNTSSVELMKDVLSGKLNKAFEASVDQNGKWSEVKFIKHALEAEKEQGVRELLVMHAADYLGDLALTLSNPNEVKEELQVAAEIFGKSLPEIIAFVEYLRNYYRIAQYRLKYLGGSFSYRQLQIAIEIANSQQVSAILAMIKDLGTGGGAQDWIERLIGQYMDSAVAVCEATAIFHNSETFKQLLEKGDVAKVKKYWLNHAPFNFGLQLEEAAQRTLAFLHAKYPEGIAPPQFFITIQAVMAYILRIKNRLPAATFEACWMSLVEQGLQLMPSSAPLGNDDYALYFDYVIPVLAEFIHSPEDVTALSQEMVKLMRVCGRRTDTVLKQKLPELIKLLREQLGSTLNDNPTLASKLLLTHLKTINHILGAIRMRQPQASDFDVPNEDDKLAITTFLFSHLYHPEKLRAIFDIYFNSEDATTNKQIDNFALKFQKKNAAAFYATMDEGMKKIHRQQARKLDYNFFIPFMMNLVDSRTTTVRPEAELFFKLFTSKELHRWRSLKVGLRIKVDLLDASSSDEAAQLFCQALRFLDARWGLGALPSHQMDEKIIGDGGKEEYRAFIIARELVDLIDVLVDLVAVSAQKKIDPIAKDFALEWKPRVMRCLVDAISAAPEQRERAYAGLREAVAQFKYFYKSQKLTILYGLFSQHVQETEAERKANTRALVLYAAKLAVNQDDKTVFDSVVEFIQANQSRPEVVQAMHKALISEAKGAFKEFRYASADYQRLFSEWAKRQIQARRAPDQVLNDEEQKALAKGVNAEAEAVKKKWEQNQYYVVRDEQGNIFYLGLTDNFSTLLNLGNPSYFGSCQACYKPAYNRGLGGYVANGWNKALVVFDDKGKFIARRVVRLRMTEKGELVLMREHTYGDSSKDGFMDRLLAKAGFDMSVRYQPDQGSSIEEIGFSLWRGNSEWDYSDTYGKQFPEDVGLVRVQGDAELKGKLHIPLARATANPLDNSFKPESEQLFKLVTDRVQLGDVVSVGFDDTSVPRDDFVVVGGRTLYFRGVQVNDVSEQDLQILSARELSEADTEEHGRIYLGNDNRLYRLRGESASVAGPLLAAHTDIHGTIHGLFVSRGEGGQKQIFINRDALAGHVDHFRVLLHSGVTIEEAIRFIEGHEAFHALVNHLRDQGRDLSGLSKIEEEKLADTFGRAFALGIGKYDPKLQDELEAIDRLLGFTSRFGQASSLITILRQHSGQLHDKLKVIGIHVEVQNATPAQMADLKAQLEKEKGIDVRAHKDEIMSVLSAAATGEDTGKCVTADTLLPVVRMVKGQGSRVKGEKVPFSLQPSAYTPQLIPITAVKPGDFVLSLNEQTQAIEPQRIKGLLDMGVKPVYKLTTASGRSIKTTANHPYLVKVKGQGSRVKGNVLSFTLEPSAYTAFQWTKVSELKEGMEIGVAQGELFRPDSNTVLFDDGQFSFELGRGVFFKESQSPADNFLFSHILNINNYYPRRSLDVKPKYITKVFIKGKKGEAVLDGVGKDFRICGASQVNLGKGNNRISFAAQGSKDIFIDTLVNQDIHNRLAGRGDLHRMFHKLRGKFNSSDDIFFGNAGVLLGDIFQRVSGGNEIEDIAYRYARSLNTGFAESDLWVNSDSLLQIICHFNYLLPKLYHNLFRRSSPFNPGCSIKTTANHPYLVKLGVESIEYGGKASAPSSKLQAPSWTKVSELKEGMEIGVPGQELSSAVGVGTGIHSVNNNAATLEIETNPVFPDPESMGSRRQVNQGFSEMQGFVGREIEVDFIFNTPLQLGGKLYKFTLAAGSELQPFSHWLNQDNPSSDLILAKGTRPNFLASSMPFLNFTTNLGLSGRWDSMASINQPTGLWKTYSLEGAVSSNFSSKAQSRSHIEYVSKTKYFGEPFLSETTAALKSLGCASPDFLSSLGMAANFSSNSNFAGVLPGNFTSILDFISAPLFNWQEYNTSYSALSSLFIPEAQVQTTQQGPVLWDKIVSIEPLPPERVYDIEVEGTHNFIGNGIFAHNTYIGGQGSGDRVPGEPAAAPRPDIGSSGEAAPIHDAILSAHGIADTDPQRAARMIVAAVKNNSIAEEYLIQNDRDYAADILSRAGCVALADALQSGNNQGLSGALDAAEKSLGQFIQPPPAATAAAGGKITVTKDKVAQGQRLNPQDETPPAVGPVASGLGGIDLTTMPIITQSALSYLIPALPPGRPHPSFLVPAPLPAELNEEWRQIQRMLQGGIIPSSQRIKEFLIASCNSPDCQQEIDKILSCIADILRLEEERSANTETALREILALIESDKPAGELRLALAKIQVGEKEPIILKE